MINRKLAIVPLLDALFNSVHSLPSHALNYLPSVSGLIIKNQLSKQRLAKRWHLDVGLLLR